jgi:hypothetical protein
MISRSQVQLDYREGEQRLNDCPPSASEEYLSACGVFFDLFLLTMNVMQLNLATLAAKCYLRRLSGWYFLGTICSPQSASSTLSPTMPTPYHYGLKTSLFGHP